ncbi:MAG: hypothetical protein IPG25_04460 [Proteobacteria bacterium]|nr:hypothetical protein [Pseudomonadota bacterium]
MAASATLTPVAGAATGGDDTAITIYSSAQPGAISPELYRPVPGSGLPNAMSVPGYAMVRHDRAIKLAAGRSQLKFSDIAGLIDPTTVTFTSVTDPRTRVLEQNFQFDLVSTDKLLQKFIDKPITVERAVGNQTSTVSGTLLSAVDQDSYCAAMTAASMRCATIPRYVFRTCRVASRPSPHWSGS